MPLILPASGAKVTAAYSVANSCRFNDGDTAYMHKTFGTGGSTTAWTMSMWVKRGFLGTDQRVFSCDDAADGDPDNYWRFTDDNEIQINIYNGSAIGNLITTRVFRDCSAWYHVCVIWKSADGTEGDRIQLWINGIRETSFSTETYPSQNADSITASQVVAVGRRNNGPQQYFDGYLAEVVFLDGVTSSPVDTLGEFDSDSPTIFKPKDPSGLSFGSTGFYLDFEDSANLGNDVNGGTDLTEVNLAATDQATDTPTNNFCVMNPLAYRLDTGADLVTYSEGNLKAAMTDGTYGTSTMGTIGVTTGKWYWEVFVTDVNDTCFIGITRAEYDPNDNFAGESIYYDNSGNLSIGTGTGGTADGEYGNTWTTDDTIGVAFDATNGVIWFSKNGTWQNSATIGEINAGTTTNAATTGITMSQVWMPFGEGTNETLEFNLGSPPYTISSGNADGDGYGNFEYTVPTGYFALCTKNLGAYGG